METHEIYTPVVIRPTPVFALIKIFPIMLGSVCFLLLACKYATLLVWPALGVAMLAAYRFLLIRATRYEITNEIIRFSSGLFFKRMDTVELFRVKDYIQTQSFILQVFCLMDLTLKTTDPENPVVELRGIPFSNLVDDLRVHVLAARQHNQIVEIN